MVVALQKECIYLAKSMEDFGYTIVVFGKYNGKIDALLYLGHMPSFSMLAGREPENGIFMVNVLYKTPVEINEMLKKRVYSRLF